MKSDTRPCGEECVPLLQKAEMEGVGGRGRKTTYRAFVCLDAQETPLQLLHTRNGNDNPASCPECEVTPIAGLGQDKHAATLGISHGARTERFMMKDEYPSKPILSIGTSVNGSGTFFSCPEATVEAILRKGCVFASLCVGCQ